MMELEKLKQHVIASAIGMKKRLSERCPSITMKMEVWTRSNGNHTNARYVFKIGGRVFEADDCSLRTVDDVSRTLTKAMVELNAKRGYYVRELRDKFWYETRDCFGRTSDYLRITVGLTFMMKPCKEFELLRRYLRKYANTELLDTDLYSVSIVGKRGTNYTESGERNYYAHDPKKCRSICLWIAQCKKPNDGLIMAIEEKRYCEDENYSREYETESYGTFYRYLKLRVVDKKSGSDIAHYKSYY
jgi:hypothetical protein